MHCGKHFASKKSVEAHIKKLHPANTLKKGVTRVKPCRIVARRNKELLCAFDSPDLAEHEWLEEEEVDVVGLEMPDGNSSPDSFFVIKSIDDWLAPVWTDDGPELN